MGESDTFVPALMMHHFSPILIIFKGEMLAAVLLFIFCMLFKTTPIPQQITSPLEKRQEKWVTLHILSSIMCRSFIWKLYLLPFAIMWLEEHSLVIVVTPYHMCTRRSGMGVHSHTFSHTHMHTNTHMHTHALGLTQLLNNSLFIFMWPTGLTTVEQKVVRCRWEFVISNHWKSPHEQTGKQILLTGQGTEDKAHCSCYLVAGVDSKV